jgi:hypothetical protein
MTNDNVQAALTSTDMTKPDVAGPDMFGPDMFGPDMFGPGRASLDIKDRSGPRWRRRLRTALRNSARSTQALSRPGLKGTISRRLVPALLIGAAVFGSMPAVAQAGTLAETMNLGSNLFPGGAPVPGGLSGTVHVAAGSYIKLTAPQYVYQPSVPPGSMGTVDEFMFWDVNATLANTATATFTAPSSGVPFRATAWYLPVCVVASSCLGGGQPAVTTWAFSLTDDQVLPETPISSVNPASAWTSPSTTVSTATSVNIAASAYLGAHTKFGGTAFGSWFVFGGGGATVSGLNLSVPADESPYAIAFYNQYSFHLPPPCIGYPHCI